MFGMLCAKTHLVTGPPFCVRTECLVLRHFTQQDHFFCVRTATLTLKLIFWKCIIFKESCLWGVEGCSCFRAQGRGGNPPYLGRWILGLQSSLDLVCWGVFWLPCHFPLLLSRSELEHRSVKEEARFNSNRIRLALENKISPNMTRVFPPH